VGGDDLAERDRPTVAELAGEVPELVSGVGHRVRVHAREQLVAGEHGGEPVGVVGVGLVGVDAEKVEHLGRHRQQ